ncbi:DUF4158 domain-containing protein [Saccharopolyspora sp. NPDC050642]|uniref:DUF4158 domain-containing protein n=1 Tax=Saccharopolyspora sp. NPDC050642 TaxID=3157099 RepID=UPI0033F5C878
MAQVFADEELERLRGFPEIGRDELFRFFTLTPADVDFVDPGRGRGPADRLGLAVALCTLPWLGFVPDKVSTAPPVAVARLADQLGIDPVELRSYGRRAKTRTEHLRLVAQYLGWRPLSTLELKELDEFLLARAMEHDSPTLLFRLACEYLISARVIRPGPVIVVKRVSHAREEAQRETFARLAHEFTDVRCAALDGLLVTDPEVKTTRLRWLATGPVEASPGRDQGGSHETGVLARPGRRCPGLVGAPGRAAPVPGHRRPQADRPGAGAARSSAPLPDPAHAAGADVLDEVVGLFDQAISAREGTAERKMRDTLAERGKSGEDRQALLDDLLDIIFDLGLDDERIGGLIRGERIGWPRLRSAREQAAPRLPRDHGHLVALDGSYGYLRQFTPPAEVSAWLLHSRFPQQQRHFLRLR